MNTECQYIDITKRHQNIFCTLSGKLQRCRPWDCGWHQVISMKSSVFVFSPFSWQIWLKVTRWRHSNYQSYFLFFPIFMTVTNLLYYPHFHDRSVISKVTKWFPGSRSAIIVTGFHLQSPSLRFLYQLVKGRLHSLPPYLIIVTGTMGGARVKIFCQVQNFPDWTQKLHIFHFSGTFFSVLGCF